MNIKNAKYKDNQILVTLNDGAEIFVPVDTSNRHYIELCEWVEKDLGMIAADDAALVWDDTKSQWALDKAKQAELFAQAEQQAVESVKQALQSHIDSVAAGLGFSSGNAVMLYAGFANVFQLLAQSFGGWEAGIWAQANQYMAQVKAGEAPMLTPEQAVERVPAFAFAGA